MKSRRAPSYQAIAMAILKNDHNLYSLGFGYRDSAMLDSVLQSAKTEHQIDMFRGFI